MKRVLADWAPVVGAVGAVVLFAAYYVLLEMHVGNLSETKREQGKVLWGSSSFVLNLAMLWCATVSSITIHELRDSFLRRQRIAIFLSFGFLYALLAALFVKEVAGHAASKLLQNIAASGVDKASLIININNLLAALIAIIFLLAFVFISRGVDNSSTRMLADRIHWFNLLVYSGGVVLATAVYEFYCLFQWAASLEGNQLRRETLQEFASSVAVGGGLVFSSLLMLIVVPPAIRLNRQLQSLMSNSAGTEGRFDSQEWLLKEGIASTPLKSLNAYVALLLPFATGLLTKAFGL